ncbi:P-loop containing nucleoside triphosphate hydrolase protein [Chaetomium tenue]|uniref:P-loop containing nucleoside triphosphate hydrolase protein n=1 Tax=Chaetomium tenue TaxID=1854479 RepID=A0ACB7P2W6_9PEZI|nr:P-loop containing nucleoside triphosphate hydrolase protein [Chaetomium globosum]
MSVRNNPFARNASTSTGSSGPGRPKSVLGPSSPSLLAGAPSPPPHARTNSHSSHISQNFAAATLAPPAPLRINHARGPSREGTPSSSTFAPSYLKTEDMRKPTDVVKGIEGENDFSGRKYVWLKDPQTAFVKGWVVEELGGNKLLVQCDDGSQREVDAESVDKVNPAKFDKANDMAELTHLNEASVVHNLQTRYMSDLIYTYSGLFLVTVNPYTPIPIYTNEYVNMYKGRNREDNKPHIFAVADEAFRNMADENENQSILVTGESGAGKTENTKKVIQYLAAVAQSQSPAKSRGKPQHSNLSAQILRANPILEAFGNAQTFIRIEFNRDGSIAGAFIDWYLFEKSRVVRINAQERNYHIFYQLLRGADRRLKQDFLLDGLDVQDFAYTRDGQEIITGVSDQDEWSSLMEAFMVMGFSDEEQASILRTIAAVLHLGNISVVKESRSADQARLAPDAKEVAAKVCKLLGVPLEPFLRALLHPKVKAGREWVEKVQTPEQVRFSIDALAKGIYERGFGDLVTRINRQLDRAGMGLDDTRFIGVLDIAGFEIFEKNSFEQLCINYTNEKLQQFFNHHMFVLEQEEYAREQIEWKFIDFGKDLQPTIDLIEVSNPIGIFSCLDEDCVMPKATDKTFSEKLNSLWDKKSQKYRPSRLGQGFILTHYAAEVEYSTDGWLDKNKDPLNDNLTRLLAASTDKHDDETGGMRSRVKKGLFRTVAQRHKEQLSSLMAQLHLTHPHFRAKQFNGPLVLDQLRCNGFPNRLSFAEFRQRGYIEGQAAAKIMLDRFSLDKSLYRIGLTKVFFRAGVLAELEEQRDALITEIMSKFQSVARGYMQRRIAFKRLYRAEATRVIQRNFQVYIDLCDNPWWQLLVRMKPLLGATRTAAEYQSLKDEYDHLNESKITIEKELYAQQDTLRRTMEARTTAEEERDEAREEIRRLRVAKTQAEEARREAEIIGERAAFKVAREREESLHKDLEAAHERLKWFDAECANLNRQIEDLNKLILESGEFGLKNDQAKERMERELHTVKSRLAASENDNRALLNKLQQKGLEIARSSSRASEASRGQVLSLQREKARLEEQNAKLNKQLGDSHVTIASLEKRLEKLQLSLEDLNHEVAREVQSSRNAEKASSNFTVQLAEANRTIESEKQLRTQAQGTVRTMQTALDARDAELTELRTQLLNALRTVDPQSVPVVQADDAPDKFISKNFDLVRKIEDLQQDLRVQTAARVNAEEQLADLRAARNESPTRRGLGDVNIDEGAFNMSPTQTRSKPNGRHYSNTSTPPRRFAIPDTDHLDSVRSDKTADILSFNNRMDLKADVEELQNQLQLAQMQNRHLQNQLDRVEPSSGIQADESGRMRKLEQANGRLHDMLDQSSKQVSALEKALHTGELSLRDIQTKSHEEILDLLHSQEDSRRAILHSHNDAIAELTDMKGHVERLRHDRAKLEVDFRDTRSDLQEVSLARDQEAASRVQLLQEFADLQIRMDAETSKLTDVTASLNLYKSRADEYFNKLEQAEIAVLKASRAEQFAKAQAREAEDSCAEMMAERNRLDTTIEDLQLQTQRLEEKIEDMSTDLESATQAKKRLQHELEDYRNQRANDVEDKESSMEQLRKKYQAEFATLTKELDLAREEKLFKQAEIARLREELDDLRSKWDDEVLNSSTWSKEKARLQTTLSDVVASRDEAVTAHNEAQGKIVSLLSQVRSLRSSVDEITSERDGLLREKRSIEARLEEAKAGLEELAKSESPSLRNAANSDKEILELKAGLAQQEDIAAAAVEKMRRAESLVSEIQKDIVGEREASAELQKQKAALEKSLNEVQLKLIDLETKGYSTASHDIKFLHKRIQELESQLEDHENERSKSQRSVRNVDRTVKDLQSQIERKDKQNGQLNEDMGRMRDKMDKLLKTIEELQASESNNELAARRAERELREEKERALKLEREVEGWKMRMEKGITGGSGVSAAGSVFGGSMRSRHVGWATEEPVKVPQRKSSISRVPSMTKGFL